MIPLSNDKLVVEIGDNFPGVPAFAIRVHHHDTAASDTRLHGVENLGFREMRIGVAGHDIPENKPET
jgi:hypothetical protein